MSGRHPATVAPRSLEAQREAFSRRRGLTMPLAGTLAWAGMGGVAGHALPGGDGVGCRR